MLTDKKGWKMFGQMLLASKSMRHGQSKDTKGTLKILYQPAQTQGAVATAKDCRPGSHLSRSDI